MHTLIKKNSTSLIYLSILLLALGIRLLLINHSFWLDEAAQALESSRPLHQQLDIAKDFQPPLFHLWLHLFTYFSLAEWWLRIASIIPGLITIFFSMHIAKKLVSHKAAFLVGILLATSQYHLFYSQELRPYSLAAMWGVISMYALIKYFSKPQKINWLYSIATLAGLLSTYVYPFLIPAQLLIVFVYQKKQLKKHILSLGLAVLVFLLWTPFLFQQLQIGLELKSNLSGWAGVVSLPVLKSIPLTFAKLSLGRVQIGLDWQTVLLSLLIIPSTLYFFIKSKKHKYFKFALIWLVVPVVGAFLVSFFIPVLEPKRVLFIQPALYLLIGMGVQAIKLDKILISLLIVGNLLAVSFYLYYPQNQREPWRQAIFDLEETVGPSSGVIFAFNEPFPPWNWYQVKDIPTLSPIEFGANNLMLNTITKNFIFDKDQIFVFEYLMELTDSNNNIFTVLNQSGYQESGYQQYPGLGRVWLFTKEKFIADHS